MASFCSDKLASPRGASCPLCSPGSHFFRSAAWFALPLAALTESSGLPVRFCRTVTSPSTISSSTRSLRIAWVRPMSFVADSLLQISGNQLSCLRLARTSSGMRPCQAQGRFPNKHDRYGKTVISVISVINRNQLAVHHLCGAIWLLSQACETSPSIMIWSLPVR